MYYSLSLNCRLTIFDDDIDLSQLANATEEDLDTYNLGEDLPQIAGIIDERPAELIAKEDYKTSEKWKTIGNDESETVKPSKNHYSVSLSPNNGRCEMKKRKGFSSPKRISRSPDASPPRRKNRGSETSPPRRINRSSEQHFSRRINQSPDASPPRRKHRSTNKNSSLSQSPGASPPRQINRSTDASPPRRKNRNPDAKSSNRFKRNFDGSRHLNRGPDASRKEKTFTDSPPPAHKKMLKTIDGKNAGLQDATSLKEENERFRKREEEMFRNMEARQNHEGK